MTKDRFEKIEGPADLPAKVKEAVAHINRFSSLEIGELPRAAAPAPAPAPAAAPAPAPAIPALSPAGERRLCRHCGQQNELQRETCWACFKRLGEEAAKAAPAGFTLVLDGVTYRSDAPDLPDDIRELMSRIEKRGYSEKLLSEWREWRAVRNRDRLRQAEALGRDIKVFKGQRVSVIRIDDRVYTSDDPNLSPELKEIFAYIDAHGVTPVLMEHLRGRGETAKFRPATTAYPSDGDVDFWKNVQPKVEDSLARRHAEEELLEAQRRHEEMRWRVVMRLVPVGFMVLFYIVAAFSRSC